MEQLEPHGFSPADENADSLMAERSRFAVAGANEGVWDWNVATGGVWYSDRWCGMLGFAPSEVNGEMGFWESRVHPDDNGRVREALTDHLSGRSEFYDSEHRLKDKGGHWIWVHARGQVVRRDRAGMALRVIGTNADITERKERELGREFLLRLNDDLRELDDPGKIIATANAALGVHLSASRVGFGEIDEGGETVTVHSDWTDGAVMSVVGRWRLADFGARLREARPGVAIVVSDTDAEAHLVGAPTTAWRAIQTRAWIMVPLVRHGRLIAVLFVHDKRPRQWTEAEVATLLQLAERLWDIVQHERALAALHASEVRLAQAAQAAGFGAWEWDVPTEYFATSDGFDALFGLPRHSIRSGEDFLDRLHPDDRAGVEAVQARLWSGTSGDILDIEYRIVLPDGGVRWLRSKGAVMARGADGAPVRLNGVVFDTTAKKEAEAELRIAQELSLRASRLSAMGALASTLAHELNQPLASTANYLAACRLTVQQGGDLPRDVLLDCIDRANGSVMRASEIIRRMRRFTISGKVTRSEGSLRAIVQRAWEPLRARATGMGVELVLALDPAADRVVCDVLQIEQVIGNVMRNAIEAMIDAPRRRLTIAARASKHGLTLRIADTGSGLAAEAARHLFEPFRTTKENGTGLGLAICRTVIEAHDGTIELGPKPASGGTEFVITLPRDADQTDADLAA